MAKQQSSSIADQSPIYPIPQEIDLNGRDMPLDGAAIFLARDASDNERFAARLLRDWIADEYMIDLPLRDWVSPGQGATIGVGQSFAELVNLPGLDLAPTGRDEGYRLLVTDNATFAVGDDERGLLYAVASLVQLVCRKDGRHVLRGCTVRDWPFLPIRHVHVYVPGKDDIPFFKRYIRDVLLRNKYNGMIMEVGGGVRLSRHPEIATGWRRTVTEMYAYGDQSPITGEACPLGPGRRFQDSTHPGIGGGAYIEPDELRDIVAFARAHGQEVIPEIQSLTHVYYLACARRDIAESPECLFPDSYCPSNEESYRLLFDIIDEYVEIIRPRAVHIGHDEWRTGGDCPKCRQQRTGDLFAQDVIRIYRHLKAKGVGVWMWGDHFYSGHTEPARSLGKDGGPVWYLHPGTEGAWKQVIEACPDILLCNWSWSMRDEQGRQGAGDAELRAKGFRFIYGNFYGQQVEDWPRRTIDHQVLGAGVSSWCRADEFQLGKMHIATALYSANMLWSTHYPPAADAAQLVMRMLPPVRERLAGRHDPDVRLTEPAQVTIDLSAHSNSPLKTEAFDLSGLRTDRFREGGLDIELGRVAVVVRRTFQDAGAGAAEVAIPIGRPLAKLVFWQSSFGKARRMLHAGDGTHFARESSEAIGFYEVRFADGFVASVPIRAGENVAAWDAGTSAMLYHSRPIVAGTLSGGQPLVIWGLDWRNERPDVPIAEVRFRGAGRSWDESSAQPILLGITGVEKVRLEDYRGKLPY